MAEKTAFEIWQDVPRYQLPHEARALQRDWWTTTQAAWAWGVSPRTARRYFEQIGTTTVIAANVRTDRVRVLHCVPANTLRPPVRRGNPNFADREYQRNVSRQRWSLHAVAANARQFLHALDEAAKQDAIDDFLRHFPGAE